MAENAPAGIDTSVAHPARRYNYLLGGKDHYQADRDSGDLVAAHFPTIRIATRENRNFLRRAITYAVQDLGIHQILDIGTGIPTADNVHEVAQRLVPEARVVYVDNDPVVLIHARALLTSTPEGRTAYIDADIRDPEKILTHPVLLDTLDFTRPIALNLLAILHFIEDDAQAKAILETLVAALPPGSIVIISHATMDFAPTSLDDVIKDVNSRSSAQFKMRSREELLPFFDGLDLVDPGLVTLTDWHDERTPEFRPSAEATATYGGVAKVR